uniref:Putative clip-domain serine protease n=2 Tax=Anopheles marajoara TaxID=58244 RepID=A0A2M4BUP5_9DIPT
MGHFLTQFCGVICLLALATSVHGMWIFPDALHLDSTDVLNKNCGESPYTDWEKPEDAREYENPWLTVFRHPEEQVPFCHGTLITEQHVLTTAICAESCTINDTIVVLGDYDQSVNPDCNSAGNCALTIERVVKDVIKHPKFVNDSYQYDIAIVLLQRPVIYRKNIKPICLPLIPIIPSSVHLPKVYNAMWTESSSRPKQIMMSYMSLDRCRDLVQNQLELHEEQMCASYARPSLTKLNGGAGSPLLAEYHDRSFQLGILSIGMPDGDYRMPYVYLNITAHISWLHDTVKEVDIDSETNMSWLQDTVTEVDIEAQ